VRTLFKLHFLPKKKKRQATPVSDKQKSREGIAVQGGALHEALELKYDLILKYLGVGIVVNQHITLFSSEADSLSLPFINIISANIQ